MNIAVIYPAPAVEKEGDVFVKEAFGRRIVGLSGYFEKIFLFLPVTNKILVERTFVINVNNIEVQKLFYTGFLGSILLVIPMALAFTRIITNVDVVYIGFPSMVAFPMWILAKIHRKPIILHVVGNVVAVVDVNKNRKGLSRLLAKYLALILHKTSLIMAKDALVVTNGRELFDDYEHISRKTLSIVTSSIFDSEVMELDQIRELSSSVCLLFVGSLIEIKGLVYLIDAVECLVNNYSKDVTLLVIGEGLERKKYEAYVNNKGLANRISFLGYVPPENGLFDYFSKADLFVHPSLSEGTPRVIVEAMSQGVPVVATCVGGIPSIVEHGKNGLLVKPRRSDELVRAILEIVHNPECRETLIENGLKTAKQCTIEKQSQSIFQAILSFISG